MVGIAVGVALCAAAALVIWQIVKAPWKLFAGGKAKTEAVIPNDYVRENSFIGRTPKTVTIPTYEEAASQLPQPLWDGHEDVIRCYNKAWQIAFQNLNNPREHSGLIAPFIDAAFNEHLFMWDSCFMLMFGKYAAKLFPFQETLDNFYAFQHEDGFICREIAEENGADIFAPHNIVSTGPNVMSWCEYEHYLFHGDTARMESIFPVLLAYHQWLRKNRTRPDGGYWTNGWASGMDNMPRLKNKSRLACYFSHGNMVWVDACMQQLLSCNILIEMAQMCGRTADVADLEEEREVLKKLINEKLWDEKSRFYYDLWADGQHSDVKIAGAYWGLLADAVPEERRQGFVEHLSNPKEFNRPNRIPTLSADSKFYNPKGDYWRGSIWAPTNYMALKGLEKHGHHALAFEIAENALKNVVEVFRKSGTLYENYAPESAQKGSIAKGDFVGWSGLFPISTLFEYVFGLKWNGRTKELVWDVFLADRFGVQNFPLGMEGTANILCPKRENAQGKPNVQVTADMDFTLVLRWNGQEERISIHQ